MAQPVFSFGMTPAPTTAASTTASLPSFGSQQPGGFSGWPASTSLSAPSVPNLTSATASPFNFAGGLPASSTTATFGGGGANIGTSGPLNFGGGGITTITSTTQAQPTLPTAAAAPFSFTGGSVSATAPVPIASTTATVQPQLGGTQSATAPPQPQQNSGFSFGGTTVTSSAAAAAGSAPAPVTSVTSTSGSVAAAGVTAASATPAPPASTITFRQLQDHVNKYTLDLEEQEKDFIEQATKVNYWDKTLMANGDKISKLSEIIDKVKVEHTQMQHSLEFLKNSQKDYENLLDALEAVLPQHITPDPERVHMYKLTENLDTDVMQMSEDLKEVIRHINESNKFLDRTDPVSQILRILNEHTDSLQWIEDQSSTMKVVLDDVSQMHQVFRRDHEKSLKLMFKNN